MKGERVLIVEDDPEFVDFLLTCILSPHGYLTQATAGGQAGLKAVQEKCPDLVLLGLGLRDTSYTRVLEQLTVIGDPPVIVLASSGEEAEALRAVRLGARDALIQPVRAEEAAAAITRVLHRERLESERDRLVQQLASSHEALERSLTETQTLSDMGKTISSNLDLEDVLAAVVQAAIELTQAQEGHLLLRDPERDELHLRTSINQGEEVVASLCLPVDDKITSQVVKTGKPVVLSSEGKTAIKTECRSLQNHTGHLVRSLVSVPIHSQDQVIGVLTVNNITYDRCFAQGDAALLSALADSAAVAIHNAQIHTRTDRMFSRAMAEMSAARSKTDFILQNMSGGVFAVNGDSRITSVNPAMEHITGWREEELLGRRYDEVFVPKDGNQRLAFEQTVPGMALFTHSSVSPSKSTILRKDKRRISVISAATPLKAIDPSGAGVLAIMHDITPEPGYKDLRREVLDTLHSQSLQLDPLTEDTLQALHFNAGSPSFCHPVTLRPIITQVVQGFQGSRSARSFQVTLAPDLPFVIGNESKTELALVNLIDNALTLGDPGQPIRISAQNDEDSVVVIVEGAGSDTEFEHIPPLQDSDDLPMSPSGDLLSLWATPQIKLYIARKLVQAQGGRVWTETDSGNGRRFHFSLPKIEVQDVSQAFAD